MTDGSEATIVVYKLETREGSTENESGQGESDGWVVKEGVGCSTVWSEW